MFHTPASTLNPFHVLLNCKLLKQGCAYISIVQQGPTGDRNLCVQLHLEYSSHHNTTGLDFKIIVYGTMHV